MSALSYNGVVKDLKVSKGTMNAMQNGKEIFKSESVYYGLHGSTRFIIGYQGQNRQVALCAPKDLEDGLHTVVYPEDFAQLPDHLTWSMDVNGANREIEKGTLTVTFGLEGESAEGSYHVTLKGSSEEVGGNFKMSNPL
jgi:hypothetical protein